MLSQARVNQNRDGQVKRIMLRNYPVRCYLDAEELEDELGPRSPSASGASDGKQNEFERQASAMLWAWILYHVFVLESACEFAGVALIYFRQISQQHVSHISKYSCA